VRLTEIPTVTLNSVETEPNVHHRVHNSTPHVPILSHLDPLYAPSAPTIHCDLIPHPRLGLISGLFPSGFPPKKKLSSPLPLRATCPAHLILLGTIYLMTLGY
jgi:hypothetical protein